MAAWAGRDTLDANLLCRSVRPSPPVHPRPYSRETHNKDPKPELSNGDLIALDCTFNFCCSLPGSPGAKLDVAAECWYNKTVAAADRCKRVPVAQFTSDLCVRSVLLKRCAICQIYLGSLRPQCLSNWPDR